MSIRFSDNKINFAAESDFVIRNRIPRTVQVLLVILAIFDLVCLVAYVNDDDNISITLLIALVVGLGLLGYTMVYFLNRFRNLIVSTEFQTAMLASANQLGTRFCCIINREGLILYVDQGFQKIFPSFMASGSRTLQELFMFIETPVELRGRMLATLKRNKGDQVVLSFKGAEGSMVSLVTTMDVIPRPKGYFIIRGRDYIAKRTDEQPGIAQRNPQDVSRLLEATLQQMDSGVVVADNHGKITYINSMLEQWLGYGAGEILQQKASLVQIFHQYVGHDVGWMPFADYDGQVVLRRKNATHATMRIHQKLLGDDNQTIGVSALVYNQ